MIGKTTHKIVHVLVAFFVFFLELLTSIPFLRHCMMMMMGVVGLFLVFLSESILLFAEINTFFGTNLCY